MKVKFWGVRGSIASPGPATAYYGGNTTCIEVRTDSNELIIIDAGTGIFPLSQTLLGEMPLTANVLISHTHWDHIQGLPFFAPNFIPGNLMRLHGAYDPVAGKGVEQVMSVQLQYSYFPVREAEMKARIEYVTLAPEESIRIGSATITPYLMNHPVVNFGYRIEANGKSIFFTGDHEPPQNIYEPTDSIIFPIKFRSSHDSTGLSLSILINSEAGLGKIWMPLFPANPVPSDKSTSSVSQGASHNTISVVGSW
jgi:phosphoribosyl 1,2-cyclic phosphodiesterase